MMCEYKCKKNEKRATIQEWDQNTQNVKQNDESILIIFTQAIE